MLHTITPGSVFGSYLGESERRLRETFEAAAAQAAEGALVIVFLDEVDALCPRRGAGGGSRQHEARVVAQLLTLLDGAAAIDTPAAAGRGNDAAATGSGGNGGSSAGRMVVVAATNRPNALDPALRRPGRLDREVAVSVPDADQRADILRCVLTLRVCAHARKAEGCVLAGIDVCAACSGVGTEKGCMSLPRLAG